ncbi:MAG: endolytic transglycosylase MltG [Oscillospiraceae bacterium]|nr:endolytic transglycosylase MltG [Oscillospiraceae bacterium]
MSDNEKKEIQDTAAENSTADAVAASENAMEAAMNDLDAMIAETEGASETASAESKAEEVPKPLSEAKPKPARKKTKKKKKKPKKRTIEQELADLAEEESQFDEWGRPIKQKRKRRKRKKTRKLSCTLVLLALILASSSVLSVTILAVAKEMYGIDKDVQDKIINIPEGATVTSIAQQLVDEDMISLPQMFRLVSRMNGKDSKYIAGEHVISASMSYESMIEELCKNYEDEREPARVYFREGSNLLDCARTLQENEICNAEKFLFYFNSGGFGYEFENHLSDKNPLKFQQMEGYCFPDTYEFYINEDPNIVAQKIYANFDSKISDGDYRKMDELGMTLDQVVTLASIVQGEAPTLDSMKMVAGIFWNRLHSPALFPKLESDPTKKYSRDVIAPNLEVNNEPMLTAYNTYEGAGLPPGAINNPGKDAIEAVLYPTQSTHYFFNANIDTKQIYYADTLQQHEENLARVQREYEAANAAANGENPNG